MLNSYFRVSLYLRPLWPNISNMLILQKRLFPWTATILNNLDLDHLEPISFQPRIQGLLPVKWLQLPVTCSYVQLSELMVLMESAVVHKWLLEAFHVQHKFIILFPRSSLSCLDFPIVICTANKSCQTNPVYVNLCLSLTGSYESLALGTFSTTEL